jgi:hypothetical protein
MLESNSPQGFGLETGFSDHLQIIITVRSLDEETAF